MNGFMRVSVENCLSEEQCIELVIAGELRTRIKLLREALLNYASEDSCINGAMSENCECAYCVAMLALEASEQGS